jgi:hypothetical protein
MTNGRLFVAHELPGPNRPHSLKCAAIGDIGTAHREGKA